MGGAAGNEEKGAHIPPHLTNTTWGEVPEAVRGFTRTIHEPEKTTKRASRQTGIFTKENPVIPGVAHVTGRGSLTRSENVGIGKW